ncbi:MAG: nucleotidyl transferase AbiEii/AbiGii toxin family protein [Nitrospirae bacterium]|nr:nucleotidyl transferase AbiEii/AbiGii toxin family protein [Nitrospirota bacterium]
MKKPVKGLRDNRILTSNQIKFLEEFVKSDLNNIFRLTGGTALSAFYLEHRLSEDLDFFSPEKVAFYLPEEFLKSLVFVNTISYTKLFDRNIFNLRLKDGTILKIEFTFYPLKNLEAPVCIDGLHLDNFLDLIVNKLCAISDRVDAKDYVDVYCAMNGSRLNMEELIVLAEKKCEIKGIRHILKNRFLQVPEGVENLPLKADITKTDIEIFFNKLVKELVKKEI